MIEKLIDIFGLEKYKNIRKIPKNTFYKEEDFNKTYEKLFTSDINGIYIISALNKSVINISDYKTEDYNYSEIYYIYISLKSTKKLLEINKIIHNFIPNPCILIFEYDEKINITTAKKRINKNDKTKTVIEENFISDSLDLAYLKEFDKEFLNDLKLEKNSFENFFRFYMDICNKILIFVLKEIRGGYFKTNLENIGIILDNYNKLLVLKRDKEQLEADYKKEVGMGEQAKIHTKIKQKEIDIENIKNLIKNT